MIRIHHESEGWLEKSVPGIAVWHDQACRVMTNGDLEGQTFYPTFTRPMDAFSCPPLNTAFSCLKKAPKRSCISRDAT